MKLPEKYRFKTWLGELGGNTLTMTLVLAFASFLNNASFLSLVAIFGTSLFYSLTARKNPLRSGVLPSLIASSILQFGYFVSGAELYPETVSIGLFLANFIIILIVALVPSAIGTFIRNRKNKKETKEREELERKTSQFSDNLRRLAMLVLFFYVQMFVVVPMAAKVSAATVTADEFIKNYDPDTTYSTKAKAVDTAPKRRMPIESPYANVSGSELEQLEAYCQSHGCSLTEVGSQLSIARINGTVSMDAYIGQLNQIYSPPPPPPRQSQWVLQEVGQWVVDGVTGKNAKGAKDKKGAKSKAKVAAKPDNRAWWQKGISWAQKTNKNIHHARDEFVNRLFNEPITAAWNYAKANPWKAAGIAAGAVLLTAAAIVSAPVAIAVGAFAVVGSAMYAGALAMAVYQHGWNGARDMVFSKETQRMAVTDPFGAVGRGTAEVAIAGFNLLPLAGATLKAPAAVTKMVQFAGGGAKSAETIKTAVATVPKFVNYVKELPTLRTVVNDAVNTGILRPQAVAVMKSMIKQAGTKLDDFPAVSNYVKGMFNASGPYVTNQLNGVGAGIASNTTKVYSEIELVEQGAAGVIAKEKVNFTPIDNRALVQKQAINIGKMPIDTKSINLAPKDLITLENANPGAHPIQRHAGKSVQFLADRIAKEGKPEVSAFTDIKTYTKVVNKTFDENHIRIRNWMSGSQSKLELPFESPDGKSVGIILKRGSNRPISGSSGKIILKKDGNGSYFILTSVINK